MVTPFHADSDSGGAIRTQRCIICFDFMVQAVTDELNSICLYCGSSQTPYLEKLHNNEPYPAVEEFNAELASDAKLQEMNHLLRSLRIWQYKIRNKELDRYDVHPLKNRSSFGKLGMRKVEKGDPDPA